MASALLNPNYRRRVNMIARAITRRGGPQNARTGVKQWLQNRNKKKTSRPKWMQRTTSKGAFEALSSWSKTTPAKRKKLERLKKQVAAEFVKQGAGYGGRSSYRTFRKGKAKLHKRGGWARRSQASKAGVYSLRSKRQAYKGRYPKRKLSGLGNYMVVDVDGVEVGIKKRMKRRASGKKRARPAFLSRKRKTTRRRKSRARKNGLALTNPKFGNLGGWFTGYALPIAIAGAAGGAIHAYANFGAGDISGRINELASKIPTVGPWVVTHAPNTLSGVLVGGGLGLVAGMLRGQPMAQKYLALTGGAVITVGAAMDAYNAMAARRAQSVASVDDLDLGALALDNMGALALDNMGALALDNLGDGMAYETAPLAGEQLYGQATLGDAYYSGADFSLGEGQALLNGSQVWVHKYGRPATRTKRASGSASHMAGVPGHRWGWLIKMIGFRRAAAIAAMKPKKRLKVLKAMRSGAIKGFQQATLQARARAVQATTAPIEELVAKTSSAGVAPVAPQGAGGPCGPGGLELAYGDPALFMGA